DGGRHRGGAHAHLARRVAQGHGAAVWRRGRDGQALRGGDGHEGRHRRGPGPRRLRFRQGLSGRTPLPRRQDHADLRGDVPDTEARHRAPAPGRGGRVMVTANDATTLAPILAEPWDNTSCEVIDAVRAPAWSGATDRGGRLGKGGEAPLRVP